jgi:hypothetical protein
MTCAVQKSRIPSFETASRGEGGLQPAFSPAGAGQVRGRASVDRRFEISDADEIPAGDRYNSRGQRPRKTPPTRPDPERVESRHRHAGLAPARPRCATCSTATRADMQDRSIYHDHWWPMVTCTPFTPGFVIANKAFDK